MNNDAQFFKPNSLLRTFRFELKWCFFGAVISFFIASIVMSGFPQGLIPHLSSPFIYSGDGSIAYEDGLYASWYIQRAVEGWVFDNPRSGFPFGSNMMDFPSTIANGIIIKIISLFTKNYYSVSNLYFLFSFPAVFIATYLVLRSFLIAIPLAVVSALLFNFVPFHFLRYAIGHISYVWYFIIPIFFYIAASIFFNPRAISLQFENLPKYALYFCGLLFLASWDIYYVFFGLILIATAGLLGAIKNLNFTSLKQTFIVVAVLVFGVFLNIMPNLYYKRDHGVNQEAVHRSSSESEIVGLKLAQMILPTPHHSQKKFAEKTAKYSQTHPFINENQTSALGIVGAIGFLLLGLFIMAKICGKSVDPRLGFLAVLVYILFIWGTMGGFSSLFSFLISPLIRSWTRVSIFIAFGAIAAFFIALQDIIQRFVPSLKQNKILWVSASLLFCFGIYDQVPYAHMQETVVNNGYQFKLDNEFIGSIENLLPKGSAVYQLPYMQFPESGLMFRLPNYGLISGFLNSKNLNWSYGGFKGRKGDLYYRNLSGASIETQIETIKKLGFSGIYIDRRAYPDSANALIGQLRAQLTEKQILARADGAVVFFQL